MSERNQELVEVAGGKWNVDPALVGQKLSKKELTEKFLAQYSLGDERMTRASGFLMDALLARSNNQFEIQGLKDVFESIVHETEDRRRQLQIDTERFAVEQCFIDIIRSLI